MRAPDGHQGFAGNVAVALAVALAIAVSASACRGPNIKDGSLRCSSPPARDCPPGYQCGSDDHCHRKGKDGGAGADRATDLPADRGGGSGDAQLPDTGTVTPKVTVTIQRSGDGTITGPGVDCTDVTCLVMVDEGATLELQANPGSGSDFKSWSGCTSTTGTGCTLTNITAPVQVTATFALSNANLVIVKEGNGSGRVTAMWAGGSLDCGPTCSAAIAPGTAVTLTATPSTGSTAAWTSPCTGSGPCMVTTTAQVTDVKATFTLNKVALTIQRTGNGMITGTGGISCNSASCPVSVNYGDTVTLQAAPAADHDFGAWTGCTTTAGTTCTVANVTAAAQVSVTFVPRKVAVTIQRSGNGKVTTADGMVNCTAASCVVSVDPGSSLALQAVPDADSDFKSWSGCTSVTGNTCALSAIVAPAQVSATFALKNASLVISRQGNGAGTVTASWAGGGTLDCGATCSASIQPGTQVTLMATPQTGSTVAWGAPCSGSGACVVTVAAGGTTVIATFTLNRYLLSVGVTGPAGTGSVLSTTAGVAINCGTTCSALVDHGTALQLAATPSSKGVFAGFTGCPSASANNCNITMTAAVTVSAAFKLANGNACAGVAECNSGFCVNSVCCMTACDQECEASCATGTCAPKPRRTACGNPRTIPGPGGAPARSELAYICDGAGKCVLPTISCPTNPTPVSCNLNTRSCCMRDTTYAFTCAATPCNPFQGAGDTFNGFSCHAANDCPLTTPVCCNRANGMGGYWTKCEASCTGGTVYP